ncbi:MAG: branched-chain amino acid ABC transporter permease [Myxococcales bacterium]
MKSRALPALLLCGALLLLFAVPRFIESPYGLHIFILVFLSIVAGQGWNVIGGLAGQYSVGHAAYYGVGAYTTLILLQSRQIAPWFGIFPAVLLSVLVALVIGSICFRLRGPYFVLASIAVAEIMRISALNWKPVTNGAEGILTNDLPPLKLGSLVITDFLTKVPFFYASLALAIAAVAANIVIARSKLGYYLQAIREDQDAAHSLGISLSLYKNLALAISAAFTALAGAFYGVYVGFIDPGTVLGLDLSVQLVLICIIGGIGTIAGPIVGSVVLVLLSEALRANLIADGLFKLHVLDEGSRAGLFFKDNLAHAHVLIYGILVVVVILFMPQGIWGFVRQRFLGRGRAR